MENAVARTAWYTLGVRVSDAASARPVCGDRFAARFVDAESERIWARFARFRNPNASNAARHRIIDDLLRDELALDPQALVVVVGAGFDTRACRLDGGRWLEVDEPGIVAHKEARLPASTAKNPLRRLSVDFATETLRDVLGGYRTSERTHVVVEGVLLYLTGDQRRALFAALRDLFPHHVLYCDLMTRRFLDGYSARLHAAIQDLGASFAPDLGDAPEAAVVAEGYAAASSTSIVEVASRMGALSVPRFVLRWLPTSREGFKVWKFERAAGTLRASEAG